MSYRTVHVSEPIRDCVNTSPWALMPDDLIALVSDSGMRVPGVVHYLIEDRPTDGTWIILTPACSAIQAIFVPAHTYVQCSTWNTAAVI